MENDGKRTVHTRDVGILLPRKIKSTKRFREEAVKGRQAGMQGQWQQESPTREYSEQLKCCNDETWLFCLNTKTLSELK